MEQRLSLVTLGVADLERSRRFYEDGLGWRRGNAHAEVVFFQLGGAVLALFARTALAADAGLAAAGSGFGGIVLAYNARSRAEVDAVLAEAKRGRRDDPQARAGRVLGRLLRLLRRPRRPSLGGRLEPGLDDPRGRQRPARRLSPGAALTPARPRSARQASRAARPRARAAAPRCRPWAAPARAPSPRRLSR